jgi:hypothetical protein
MSAQKEIAGKPQLALVPYLAVSGIAEVFDWASRVKYKRWNWTLGMPISVSLSAALRHVWKFLSGEENDHESGLPHLAHALTMITIAFVNYTERRALVDDRRCAYSDEDLKMTPREIRQKLQSKRKKKAR